MTQGYYPPQWPQQHDPRQPAPVVPYATPSALGGGYSTGAGLFRRGRTLVMHRTAMLPPCCVKCASAEDPRPLTPTLSWHNPALYFLILFPGLLIYAIVALCVRKTAKVTIYLCPHHRASRSRRIMAAWAFAILLIAGVLTLGAFSGRDPFVPGLFMMVVAFIGLVVALIMTRVVTPEKIDDQWVYIKGTGVDYLAQFPQA
jgi:hypothetical protein